MKIKIFIIITAVLLIGWWCIADPESARTFLSPALLVGSILVKRMLLRYLSQKYSRRYYNAAGQKGYGTWSHGAFWSNLAGGAYYYSHTRGRQGKRFTNTGAGGPGKYWSAGGRPGGAWPGGSAWRSGWSYQSTSSFYTRFRNRSNSYRVYPGLEGTDPYQVLGVKNGATMEEIKKAFREKLKRFHPDVAESRGLGPESQKACEEKTRQICRAYRMLGGR